jgi:hypothetical protein
MLTRRQALAEYDFQRRLVLPDRLVRRTHAAYADYAARMLDIYRQGRGRLRADLHRDVQLVLLEDAQCPPRRWEAFCKLLDDVAEYDRRSAQRAAELRRDVFQRAAAFHPLVARADRIFRGQEDEVKAGIATELKMSWHEIEGQLFADMFESQRLSSFPSDLLPQVLLARYNVAQTQAVLFDAVTLTIWTRADFKTILRYAKLARLMHTIRGTADGAYCIRLDGPASILDRSQRYGAAMARFLPALIACRDWRLHAVVRPRRPAGQFALELSAQDGLRSHLPAPQEFDSRVEERFAREWGSEREGWRLRREDALLHARQKVFVPDFVFEHQDGRRVLLEIVGYWTPAYLEAKLRTLRVFADHRILVAVAASAARQLPLLGQNALLFRTRLDVDAVLAALRTR